MSAMLHLFALYLAQLGNDTAKTHFLEMFQMHFNYINTQVSWLVGSSCSVFSEQPECEAKVVSNNGTGRQAEAMILL